jgi:DNA-binding CsgD family transcriptional regulator
MEEQQTMNIKNLEKLNQRQFEVLQVVCECPSYKEAANRLSLSIGAVQYHMGNIYDKLELTYLDKAARQRALGMYCEVVPHIPKPVGPPQHDAEPETPSPQALEAVQEDVYPL